MTHNKVQRIILGSFICLFALSTSAAQTLQFERQKIASESYESVGVFDVNGNGQLDIISGEYWYERPEYSATDLNDSGYMDIVVAGKDGLYVFFNNGFD